MESLLPHEIILISLIQTVAYIIQNQTNKTYFITKFRNLSCSLEFSFEQEDN